MVSTRSCVVRKHICLHGSILEIGLWVTLLGVDEYWELGRVAEEEDGRVVENPIPIAFLSVEFDGEASRISSRIWASLLTTNG